LTERGGYELCCLCDWEDDGQDDADADDVRGGPNGSYSLTEARENFRRHWVMYRPDADMRIGGGDSDKAVATKKRMAQAFDAMKGADDAEGTRASGGWCGRPVPLLTASLMSASDRTKRRAERGEVV
jgi:hypothetical protein